MQIWDEQLAPFLAQISPPSQQAMDQAQQQWDSVAKPLGSLGLLEQAVIRIAGCCGRADLQVRPRAVLVFCADNGVVRAGVTQTGSEVTALVAKNMTRGEASVCHMAALADAEVIPVDMGMENPVPGCLDRRIAAGTGNIAQGPAMTREQACQAIRTGIELVRERQAQGYHLLVTGEMGIGNTTTASAVTAALLGLDPARVSGRGAGLSDQGLTKKISVIRQALAVNQPNPEDPVDILAKVGGFDIGAMTGVFLGGGLYQVPVLLDGVISAAAALLAARLCPNSRKAMVATHTSAEPAAQLILAELGLEAPIQAGLRLGEGSGAVCFLPLLDMALAVYGEMSTFHQIGLAPYEHLEKKPC